jgi:hypothetical protein
MLNNFYYNSLLKAQIKLVDEELYGIIVLYTNGHQFIYKMSSFKDFKILWGTCVEDCIITQDLLKFFPEIPEQETMLFMFNVAGQIVDKIEKIEN